MGILTNLDLLSVGIAIAGTVVLGFAVFLNDRRNFSNRTFLIFSIITAIWGVLNYISYQFSSDVLTLWLLRLVLFFAVLQAFSLYTFLEIFPRDKVSFSRIYRFILFPVAAIVAFLSLTPFIFSGFERTSAVSRIATPVTEPGIILFGVVSIGFVFIGIWSLLKKTRKGKGEEKKSLKIVLWGLAVMFFLIITFNFFFTVGLNDVRFIPFGALFTFPFILLTSYTILKHKFFNLKIAGVSLLIFSLSIVSFGEIIFAEELYLLIYRSSIFILVLSFGILLIQSVLREVRQREQLEILSKELAAANAELKKLDQLKSDFLSFVSHQLRAPLTVIKGYISMIQEGTYGQIPQNISEVLSKVFISNEKLIRLVNDFLNLSRIEQGRVQFEFEKASVAALVDEAVEALKDNAVKRGLQLLWQKPEGIPEITIDKSKVYEIIYNLIDNAVKYTQKGSVSVLLSKKPKSILIAVKDSGIGISKEEIKQLFQRFGRAESGRKVNTGGTGIGLYVAKYMVEAHKGRIWAESAGADKGSTFFVELPIG